MPTHRRVFPSLNDSFNDAADVTRHGTLKGRGALTLLNERILDTQLQTHEAASSRSWRLGAPRAAATSEKLQLSALVGAFVAARALAPAEA